MKKTDLINCPKWLLDAKTECEDVYFDDDGILVWRSGDFLGGNFYEGNFLGGNFLGGNFMGGNFLGGNFWDGNFYDGNFRGGNFRGGNFYDGNFHDGNFRADFLGGNFLGGNFLGGNFRGGYFRCGYFRGYAIDRTPITINGLRWVVTITQKGMSVGCETHSAAEWKGFSSKKIAAMDEEALDFWRANRKVLLAICDYEASFPVVVKTA